jgi:hypothetical protein
MASPMPAPSRPARIPMCQAFFEAVAIVRNGLESNGIRWNPEAEQDAVSTLLIQAGKAGMLLPWNPPSIRAQSHLEALPDPSAPKRETVPPTAIPINRPSEPRQDAHHGNAAPFRGVSVPETPQPLKTPSSAKSLPVMLRAFREIAAELPPEVFTAVLAWYGVTQPEDFQPDQVNQAAACYVALKLARDQYQADQLTTVEHFEQTEEGWR